MSFAPPELPPTVPPTDSTVHPTGDPLGPNHPSSAFTSATPRRLDALTTATWLATLGTSLLLVAATIVVTSRWTAVADWVKASGLVVATMVIIGIGERLQREVPRTSLIVAHLGASLVTPAAVAATAASGGTWPVCVIAGGLAGAAANEVQHRRRAGRLMPVAQVVAIVVGLAGVAALTPIALGPLVGLAALAMLAVGCERRSVGLAVLGAVAPLAWLATLLDAGPGTLARIGVTGSTLAWAAPLAGLLSAVVMAIVARRHHRMDLAWGAALALVGNVVVATVVADLPDYIDFALVPALVLLVEMMAAVLRGNRATPRPFDDTLDAVRAVAALVATGAAAALILTIARLTSQPAPTLRLAAVILAAAAVVGWCTSPVTRWRTALLATTATAATTFAIALTSPFAAAVVAGAAAFVLLGALPRGERGLAVLIPTVLAAGYVLVVGADGDAQSQIVCQAVIGLEGLVCGRALRSRLASRLGGATLLTAALHYAAIAVDLAPIAVWLRSQRLTGADLAMLLALGGTIAAGHRWGRRPLGDWIAVVLPQGLLALVVVGRQLDTPSASWTTLGFAAALTAVAIGAHTRLRSLLVVGTATVGATVVLSARKWLTQLPGWAWLTLGGLLLVGLAVATERSAKAAIADE